MTPLSLGLRLGNQAGGNALLPEYMAIPLIGDNIQILKKTTSGAVSDIFVLGNHELVVDASVPRNYSKIQHRFQITPLQQSIFTVALFPPAQNIGYVGGQNRSIATGIDDIAPIKVNGDYVGGNHGYPYLAKIVKVGGHGLNYSDIGTTFTDANGTAYILVMLDGANPTTTAYFIIQLTGNSNQWVAPRTAMSGTLTQDGGSGKTITNASRTDTVSNQLKGIGGATTNESLNTISIDVYADGNITIANDTAVVARYALVVETYKICNPFTELAYIVENKGTFNANPTWNYTPEAFVITNRYHVSDYGKMMIFNEVDSKIEFAFSASDYLGGTQSSLIALNTFILGANPVCRTYLPNVIDTNPSSGLSKLISTQAASYTPPRVIGINELDNKNIPFSRSVQMAAKEDNTPMYARAMGYSELLRQSSNMERMTNTDRHAFMSGKTYFLSFNGLLTSGKIRKFLTNAYWSYFVPYIYGNCSLYWRNERGYCLVYIDYHSPYEADTITLPILFNGKSYTVQEKSENIAIGGTLPNLSATTTGTAGSMHEYAILKVL